MNINVCIFEFISRFLCDVGPASCTEVIKSINKFRKVGF